MTNTSVHNCSFTVPYSSTQRARAAAF